MGVLFGSVRFGSVRLVRFGCLFLPVCGINTDTNDNDINSNNNANDNSISNNTTIDVNTSIKNQGRTPVMRSVSRQEPTVATRPETTHSEYTLN